MHAITARTTPAKARLDTEAPSQKLADETEKNGTIGRGDGLAIAARTGYELRRAGRQSPAWRICDTMTMPDRKKSQR